MVEKTMKNNKEDEGIASAYKINTDRSVGQWERGSFGGLFQSEKGKWIKGFCGYIGWSTVIKAELWAIKHVLKLCKTNNWEGVPIKSDSLMAVKLIEGEEDVENHSKRILIEDCRKLIREMNTAVSHIYREANKCANILAKIGGSQREQAVRILVSPEELIDELNANMQGISYQRGM